MTEHNPIEPLDESELESFWESVAHCTKNGTTIHDPEKILSMLPHAERIARELRSRGTTLVLDLDDTLITNSTLYVQSQKALAKLVGIRGSKNIKAFIKEFDEFDISQIPLYGFSKFRWYNSIHVVAERKLGEIDRHMRIRLDEIASIPFRRSSAYPDVAHLIKWLRAYGVPIYIITKGEEGAQRAKIQRHGLDAVLNGWWAVPTKNADVLKAFIHRNGITNPIVIGDSLNSDITPALELGLDCALIRYHYNTWEYENSAEQDGALLVGGSLIECLLRHIDS